MTGGRFGGNLGSSAVKIISSRISDRSLDAFGPNTGPIKPKIRQKKESCMGLIFFNIVMGVLRGFNYSTMDN